MKVRLNWRNQKHHFCFQTFKCWTTLIGIVFLVNASIAQSKLSIKKKEIAGEDYTYLKIGIGSSYPCGEFFGISLEDTSKHIFSASSAFCATLLVPNDTLIDFPNDGVGANGKRNSDEQMSYQKAFERIKHLKPGYQQSNMGEKWDLSAEQIKELYPNQAYDVDYNDQSRTAFNYNNIFYEMLMSIQLLAQQNEEQQTIIDQQAETIAMLNERLHNIENTLDIDKTFTTNKILGEVNINPNPITNGTLQVDYHLNQNTSNVQLNITDIQGKKVYESPLNAVQKRGNQNLNIDLPAGTYLYYLENDTQQTNPKKLMIQ